MSRGSGWGTQRSVLVADLFLLPDLILPPKARWARISCRRRSDNSATSKAIASKIQRLAPGTTASFADRSNSAMNVQPSVHDAMLGAVPQLRAFAMKLCRNVDQADDLVQETIARGCKNIDLFEPGTNMVAWLSTILRNHFLSECRRSSYRLSDAIEDH